MSDSQQDRLRETYRLVFDRVKQNVPDWESANFNQATFTSMSGYTSCVIGIKHEGCQPVLYRVFENSLANASMEQVAFEAASEEGLGPILLYRGEGWRLESFFEGRPISIWEMRNPYIMCKIADIFFAYNFNKRAREAAEKIQPCD